MKWDGTSERILKHPKVDRTPVYVKIIVADEYICNEHGLWKGKRIYATPNYTSTKKLKGYIVKSPKKGIDIHIHLHEVEILPRTND